MEKKQKIDLVVRTFTKIEKSLDAIHDGAELVKKNKAKVMVAGGLGILLLGIWITALFWSFRFIAGQLFKPGKT